MRPQPHRTASVYAQRRSYPTPSGDYSSARSPDRSHSSDRSLPLIFCHCGGSRLLARRILVDFSLFFLYASVCMEGGTYVLGDFLLRLIAGIHIALRFRALAIESCDWTFSVFSFVRVACENRIIASEIQWMLYPLQPITMHFDLIYLKKCCLLLMYSLLIQLCIYFYYCFINKIFIPFSENLIFYSLAKDLSIYDYKIIRLQCSTIVYSFMRIYLPKTQY